MQLKLDPHFNTSQSHDPSWSDFEASDNVISFGARRHDEIDCQNYLIPYHKTLEDLYRASEECDLCRALLHSAADMIRLRNGVQGFHPPSGEGLFLSGISNSQGIQVLVLESACRYALLGGVGFSVDNCKFTRGSRGNSSILSRQGC